MFFKRSSAFLPLLVGTAAFAQAPNLSTSATFTAAPTTIAPQLNVQTWTAVKSASDSRSVIDATGDHGHDVVCSARADSSITQVGNLRVSGRHSLDGHLNARMRLFDLGAWTEVTLTGSVDSSFLLPSPGGYAEASFRVEHSTYVHQLRSAKSNATGARTSTSPLRLEAHENILGGSWSFSRLVPVSGAQRLAVQTNGLGTIRLDLAALLVPVGPNAPSVQLTGPTRIDTFGHFVASYQMSCVRITIDDEFLMPLDCTMTADFSSTPSGPNGNFRLQDRQTRFLLRLIKSFCGGAQSVENAIDLLFPAVDRVQVLR